jgi:hypothetical protein
VDSGQGAFLKGALQDTGFAALLFLSLWKMDFALCFLDGIGVQFLSVLSKIKNSVPEHLPL